MATTTNYSWTTPDDTALVKDGAAAIRTLGSSVDTTVKALNPETTLGDISYRSSTANTNTRLPLGTAGQVLKVNSGATAPEWGSATASFAGCSLTNSAGSTQNMTSAAYTLVTWSAEVFDTNAFHSTSTNTGRITIPSGYAGYYSITASQRWDGTTGGTRLIDLRKNGTSILLTAIPPASIDPSVTLSGIFSASVGDYFEIYGYQNSGSTRTIYATPETGTSFSVGFLGA